MVFCLKVALVYLINICILQSMCVHIMDFVSAHKQINYVKLNMPYLRFHLKVRWQKT